MEVLTGESDEEEDPDLVDGDMGIQGDDGQHYVVLEVIQLPDDGSGNGPTQGIVQIPRYETR